MMDGVLSLDRFIDEGREVKGSSTVTHVTSKTSRADNERKYLIVYDISADISSRERMKIYRTLNRIYHQLVSKGVEAERIQLSVWLVEGRDNALWLANAIPRDIAKVEVYEVSNKIL
jgi:ribosomal protein L18